MLRRSTQPKTEATQSTTEIERDIRMNTLQLKGNWNIMKGKLKQKYASLTDDDLQYFEGKEDELMGRIQKRTGQTKEQVEKFLSECEVCDK